MHRSLSSVSHAPLFTLRNAPHATQRCMPDFADVVRARKRSHRSGSSEIQVRRTPFQVTATKPETHVTTLIYAQRGDAVVLLRRRKEPNRGLWSPPGGKVEAGESPLANARRELEEETGLVAGDMRLAVIVSELEITTGERWLMFVFHSQDPLGELSKGSSEGKPRWVDIPSIKDLEAPPADGHILEAVLAGSARTMFLNVIFENGRLVSAEVDGEG